MRLELLLKVEGGIHRGSLTQLPCHNSSASFHTKYQTTHKLIKQHACKSAGSATLHVCSEVVTKLRNLIQPGSLITTLSIQSKGAIPLRNPVMQEHTNIKTLQRAVFYLPGHKRKSRWQIAQLTRQQCGLMQELVLYSIATHFTKQTGPWVKKIQRLCTVYWSSHDDSLSSFASTCRNTKPCRRTQSDMWPVRLNVALERDALLPHWVLASLWGHVCCLMITHLFLLNPRRLQGC